MKREHFATIAALVAAVLLLPRMVSSATRDEIAPGESEGDDAPTYVGDPLTAFLFMIQAAETTLAQARSGDAYHIFYGNTRFENFSDHPALTGERQGVRLSDAMCRAAGQQPGCVSTAAGAYQINLPTWRTVREAGAWGPYLGDFSPASQDEGARRLLVLTGALDALLGDDVETAIALAASRWASLPGSTAQQSPKSLERVIAFYNEGLSLTA